jgi:predicted kinase
VPYDQLQEIDAELRSRLLGLVAEGRDVVLDFPFSTRAMRDDYRALLAPTAVVPETIYLATPRDVVLHRLGGRDDCEADDLVIGDELARRHFDTFEAPTDDEGPLLVVAARTGSTGSSS